MRMGCPAKCAKAHLVAFNFFFWSPEPWLNPKPRSLVRCQSKKAQDNDGSRYQTGCYEKILAWFERDTMILIAIAVGVGGMEKLIFMGGYVSPVGNTKNPVPGCPNPPADNPIGRVYSCMYGSVYLDFYPNDKCAGAVDGVGRRAQERRRLMLRSAGCLSGPTLGRLFVRRTFDFPSEYHVQYWEISRQCKKGMPLDSFKVAVAAALPAWLGVPGVLMVAYLTVMLVLVSHGRRGGGGDGRRRRKGKEGRASAGREEGSRTLEGGSGRKGRGQGSGVAGMDLTLPRRGFSVPLWNLSGQRGRDLGKPVA
ncbi:unnamed protein product [Notodromas monacha]|uniref:Uncharacterized protein n=1 Tax=Notodromas monacha TaxID=399045 RepID=A0A7R9BTZ0_9CRUS|nr:unnamed protein product [Notodromas monacha]CAG0920646.1 unnamed protein product [Notodromas monacha]